MTGMLLAALNRLLNPLDDATGDDAPKQDWFGVAAVAFFLLCAAATVAAISRQHP